MEDRNKLFRKAHALLVEEGASKEEARALVKETLRQGRRPSGGSSSSSGKGRRPSGGSSNNSGRGRMPDGGISNNLGIGSIIFCERITFLTETVESRRLIFLYHIILLKSLSYCKKKLTFFSQTMEAEAIVEVPVGKVERHLL